MYELRRGSGDVVLSCLWLFAFLKGGQEERFATSALVANVAITLVLEVASPPHLKWAYLAIDALLLLVLIGLALRSAKAWPMMAASCQLVDTLTHVAVLVDPRIGRWTPWTSIIIWTYALMITIGVGVWNHWRSERYLASAGPGAPAADTRR